MQYRTDRSVESTNTPTMGNSKTLPDYAKYRCMVTEVLFVDNPLNITRNSDNPRVMYNCIILGGFKAGNPINNCRVQTPLGSNTSFYERILKPTTKVLGQDRLSEHDGEIVFVEFIQGDRNFPVITGYDNAFESLDAIGATRAQGPRKVESFNGLTQEINNKGEFTLTRTGGTSEEGIFTPAEEREALLEMITGLIQIADPNQTIKLIKDSKIFEHTIGLEDTTYQEVIDGSDTEKGTRTFKSGLTVTEDGKNDKMEIVTAGGTKILIDGQNDLVEIKDNDTGTLKITGNTVALGANGIEILQQMSDSLDKLLTWANTIGALHDHLGNLGYPTAVPTQTADYISLGSDLAAIKANIDSIKGSL